MSTKPWKQLLLWKTPRLGADIWQERIKPRVVPFSGAMMEKLLKPSFWSRQVFNNEPVPSFNWVL
jgi:hypothetical protein